MLIDYSKLDYSTNTSNYPEKFFIPDIAVEFGKPSHNLDNSRESLAISHLQALLQMKILNSSTINIYLIRRLYHQTQGLGRLISTDYRYIIFRTRKT